MKPIAPEVYQARMKDKWGDSFVLDITNYVDSETKCRCICEKHGEVYMSPYNAYHFGCNKCGRERTGKKKMTKNEIILKELLEVHHGDIMVDEKTLHGLSKRADFYCKNGHKWKTCPIKVIRGKKTGCPYCAGVAHLDGNEFRKRILEVSKGTIDVLDISKYERTHDYIDFVCLVCDYVWNAYGNNILRGYSGCPKCSGHVPPSIEEVEERLEKVSKGSIKILNKPNYKNLSSVLQFECQKDGHVWEAIIGNVLKDLSHCPKCTKTSMELPVIELLNKKKVKYKHNRALKDCVYDKKPLQPDFYIETEKGVLWIETDGKTHFVEMHGQAEFERTKNKDAYKNSYCKKNGHIIIRATSSPTKEWGEPNHVTLPELLHLLDIGIDENGNVALDVFRPYDFNRD